MTRRPRPAWQQPAGRRSDPIILDPATPERPPVEVTITVPGPYTATIKGGVDSAREGVNEAIRGLAIAAQLVNGHTERAGAIL